MIEIRIPKEIREYKEKIFLNMTLRQLICNIIAIAIGIPSYIYGRRYIGEEAMSWIVIVVVLFIALVGYYNYNGLTFEKFLVAVIKFYVYPTHRKYMSVDALDKAIENECDELEKEVKNISSMGKNIIK